MSDSYDMKEVDGVVYEVDCAMITLGAVKSVSDSSSADSQCKELKADES